MNGDRPWNTENLRAITGLVAVVTGVGAVIALAIVTVSFLGSGNKESVVAVTSSAFGIVSAVVSAYLGIKASVNSSEKAGKRGEEAAIAQYEAGVKENKLSRLDRKISELESNEQMAPEVAEALRKASSKAEEEARIQDPQQGGGGG